MSRTEGTSDWLCPVLPFLCRTVCFVSFLIKLDLVQVKSELRLLLLLRQRQFDVWKTFHDPVALPTHSVIYTRIFRCCSH